MKILQKLILPLLIILVVFIIYTFYFDKEIELGSFDTFDPNNNAVKEILVQLVPDQNIDNSAGSFNFSVVDKNGKVLKAFGSASLPEEIHDAQNLILKGHVTQNGFCTHEVLID